MGRAWDEKETTSLVYSMVRMGLPKASVGIGMSVIKS